MLVLLLLCCSAALLCVVQKAFLAFPANCLADTPRHLGRSLAHSSAIVVLQPVRTRPPTVPFRALLLYIPPNSGKPLLILPRPGFGAASSTQFARPLLL